MSSPIIIVKYNSKWPDQFLDEKILIEETLGELVICIDHIGSTAVPGLAANPILDIMVGISNLDKDSEKCINLLQKIDYHQNPNQNDDFPEQRSLDKEVNGIKIHLYLVEANGEFRERHILFRNYLRAHPKVAKDYNDLKKKLAKKYHDDSLAYSEGKSKFIKKVEDKARKERKKYLS